MKRPDGDRIGTTLALTPAPLGFAQAFLSRLNFSFLLIMIVGVGLGALILIPLGLLILNSFRDVTIGEIGFGLDKFTLQNYFEAYGDPYTYTMLFNTFLFACGSMAVSFILGGTMAYLVERTDAPFRRYAYGLMLVPLIMPNIINGIAWILLLSPRIGMLNQLTSWFGLGRPFNPNNLWAMSWVEGISISPLAFLMLGAALKQMDPALEDAAATAGASPLRVLRKITLPVVLPAIGGVAVIQFVRGLEGFEVPLLLGLEKGYVVFSTSIWLAIRMTFPPKYGLAFAYGATIILLAGFALILYQRMMSRTERFTVVTGKAYRARTVELGRWRTVAVGFMLFYLLAGIGLPFFTLLWASVQHIYRAPSWAALQQLTLEHYTGLFERQDAIIMLQNTVILITVSTVVIMVLSLIISWVVLRVKSSGAKIIDAISFLPQAMPAIVMGLGFMIIFLSFRNPIYGSVWILVIAYSIRFLPLGTRFTHAGLVQIHKELEEAAQVCGGNTWLVFRRVLFPLLTPTLVGGGLFVAILSIKVLSMAALLWTPKSIILAVHIWQTWEEGNFAQVGALSVLLMVLIGALTVVAHKLTRGDRWMAG
jgi:iron(III) transport system permease protein